MLIAIGSVKGSPGATTLAMAMAARWPTPGATVVEADPGGGSAAAWFGLCREPGLAALATAAARSTTHDGLTPFAQQLPVDVPVVLGPSADEAPQTVALLAS
ncbi:MAG: hypothetical protein JWN87_1127, partial [Frankiales bacterium]|nr:hypothetical protein [Frankiales bacterium]